MQQRKRTALSSIINFPITTSRDHRYISPCEKCVLSYKDCDTLNPSLCGGAVQPLGHFSAIHIDEPVTRSSFGGRKKGRE